MSLRTLRKIAIGDDGKSKFVETRVNWGNISVLSKYWKGYFAETRAL